MPEGGLFLERKHTHTHGFLMLDNSTFESVVLCFFSRFISTQVTTPSMQDRQPLSSQPATPRRWIYFLADSKCCCVWLLRVCFFLKQSALNYTVLGGDWGGGGGRQDPHFHAGASVFESLERERQTVESYFYLVCRGWWNINLKFWSINSGMQVFFLFGFFGVAYFFFFFCVL